MDTAEESPETGEGAPQDAGGPMSPLHVETPATDAPSPAPGPSAVEAAVMRWFNAHIANSPVSRSVEAVNHLRAVLPDLVSILEKRD